MTESDWLGCSSAERLLGLTPLPLSERRWRLLACGICRQFERFEGDEVLQAALEAAEDFADGTVSPKKLGTAQRKAYNLATELTASAQNVMNAWQYTQDETRRQELAEQATAGVQFSAEQRRWLDAIKDHIASSLSIERDDLDEVPFNQIGGLGRAHELFGERLPEILEDLNLTLAA